MLAAALTAHPGGSFRSERAVSRAGSARGATTIDEPIPWIPKLDRHLCAGTALLAGRFGHQAVDGLALPRLTRVTTERSADRACRAPRSLRNGPRARLTRSAARHREAARRDPLPKCAAKRPPNPNCRAHASSGGRVRSSRESPRAAPACASARGSLSPRWIRVGRRSAAARRGSRSRRTRGPGRCSRCRAVRIAAAPSCAHSAGYTGHGGRRWSSKTPRPSPGPQREIEVVDKAHLPGPLHMRRRHMLLARGLPRPPIRVLSCAIPSSTTRPSPPALAICSFVFPLAEPAHRDTMPALAHRYTLAT